MEYAIKTPAGTITVDHECTMRRLAKRVRELGGSCIRRVAKPDATLLQAVSSARGISEEQYVREVLDHVNEDGAVNYLRITNNIGPFLADDSSQRPSGAIALPR